MPRGRHFFGRGFWWRGFFPYPYPFGGVHGSYFGFPPSWWAYGGMPYRAYGLPPYYPYGIGPYFY